MPGERRPVLGAHAAAMARHGRQVKQDREPRRALHQGADGGTAQAEDEVPLPVARHRPIGRLRRALADQDLGGEAGLAPSAAARPRHPQRPPGAQAGGQLAAQRPAALHVQRLIDGFVADAHGLIVAEVEPQAAGDLVRAPGCGPPPVLPTPVSAALPRHDGPVHRRPVRGDDKTGEPVLHVAPQRRVDRQLGSLRTAGGAVGMPLRGRGPVRQSAAAADTPGAWYRGHRLVSLDGTTIDLPDAPDLVEHFGRPAASRGASSFPQLRLLTLMETGPHAIFAMAFDRYDVGETGLAPEVPQQLRPGMLCLADRAFVGFDLWCPATVSGADLLWRV